MLISLNHKYSAKLAWPQVRHKHSYICFLASAVPLDIQTKSTVQLALSKVYYHKSWQQVQYNKYSATCEVLEQEIRKETQTNIQYILRNSLHVFGPLSCSASLWDLSSMHWGCCKKVSGTQWSFVKITVLQSWVLGEQILAGWAHVSSVLLKFWRLRSDKAVECTHWYTNCCRPVAAN